ncbi:MAG TPA: DNA/RNA non-specific endonuclease [Allosphingosinicella sp.]|jgi:endonuclease G
MLRNFLLPFAVVLAVAAPAGARRPRAHPASAGSVQPAAPAPAPCLQFYLAGQPPVETAPGADERLFCHSFYATNYSTSRRDPIWTSYHLTAAMARASDAFDRHSRTFAPQDSLAAALQGSHNDFENPPFDRGHLTPDNDAPDLPQQADTYVVTNIVPQISGFNEGLWSRLEKATHKLAESERELYIVTGSIFGPSRPPMNGITVPSALYKAIYAPSRGFALAFISTNANPTVCRIVAIAEIKRQAGVDPFPSLPAPVKARLPAMPPRWGNFPRACR